MNLFNKTVTISQVGRDGHGSPVLTALGSFAGHIEYNRKNTFDLRGQQITTTATVYVDQSATLSPASEYQISVDGLEMTSQAVMLMEDPRGSNQNNHWQLECR